MIRIDGFWTTRAGDYNPRRELTTTRDDARYFYRVDHAELPMRDMVMMVVLDGEAISISHGNPSNDGKETEFFDVPEKFRTGPGQHKLRIKIYQYTSESRVEKENIYNSDEFTLIFT